MTLPKGHLSPSQMTAWDLCEVRYRIFNVEGAKSPPDFVLHSKIKTHEVILEKDLSQKITSGKNMADSDLSEIYRAEMEQSLPLAKEDPNLEGDAEAVIETEIGYFDKILTASRKWRAETNPIEVEKKVTGMIGGIPVEGYVDLTKDETICTRIDDLKRQGSHPGPPEKNRQLVTYSILTGITDVGLSALVENKTPVMDCKEGEVTKMEQSRVAAQYQGAAAKIEFAVQKDVWVPVDHGDPRMAWVCSAKFCGAWRRDSRDWLTGNKIACPWGERSQVTVAPPKEIFGLKIKDETVK